ncbi:MAG: UDP-N-acetylmuramoyl-tripeptide--D-alanyl-D-alanine ligase [Thermomonas sp.]
MKALRLARIAQWCGGRLHGDDAEVDAVSTDTRTLAADGRRVLFVALKGENFDGHDSLVAFVGGASAPTESAEKRVGTEAPPTRAPVAALVSRTLDIDLPQVIVADTERALGDIARTLQERRVGKVLAVTGSNGKTSVKSLLLAILAHAGKAYANPGNRNNEIGLPLAVIDAPDDADFAVYEMGAGKPGDIAYLTAIARPNVALVNNIAPAHLERMGSLLGVADTKAAIYDALPADGVAVVNADDAFSPYFIERAKDRRVLCFGLDASANVTARDIAANADGSRFVLATPQGEVRVELALAGRHNMRNALAAAAMSLGAGVSLDAIRAGLGEARAVAGRLVRHRLGNGALLIDDSYNANPGSLDAAIDTLASSGGEAWLVLGDMRELGDDARALHAAAGRRAKAAGIARLYALGELSAATVEGFGAGARHFDSHEALADALHADMRGDVRILVKGSRGSAMDRVVAALLEGESQHAA